MRISDLVNKVEPFTFEYDGFALSGEYYKFKTTTPAYAKAATEALPKIPEDGTEEEKAAAEKEREEALGKMNAKIIADTIKSWNAEDENGAVPPTLEVIEQLPLPFTQKFLAFIAELREGTEQKKLTPSPSG